MVSGLGRARGPAARPGWRGQRRDRGGPGTIFKAHRGATVGIADVKIGDRLQAVGNLRADGSMDAAAVHVGGKGGFKERGPKPEKSPKPSEDLQRDRAQIDRHVERVMRRVGVLPPKATLDEGHDLVLGLYEPDEMYEAHVNLIQHGRKVCHALRPDHDACPLVTRCRFVDPKAP